MKLRPIWPWFAGAVVTLAGSGCRERTSSSSSANEASARASAASSVPSAGTEESSETVVRPRAVPSVDLANAPGPAPGGSAVPREVRETAVLALLTDATFVRRAPLVDLEPEREFDWSLRDRVAPRIAVPLPKLRVVETQAKGGLPNEVVGRIVRQRFGRFRSCYATALATSKNLVGRVTLELSIERDGRLTGVKNASSTLKDATAVRCMIDATQGLEFPKTDESTVARQTLEFSPS
ncbi:MAG TPA: AgmX/PglI C-terminal domain-containing protein [Polyangiaceae bacterium]|nr:AgmX/PglI C-terminal domain-containing protein [Polyangiaceae bacterium]